MSTPEDTSSVPTGTDASPAETPLQKTARQLSRRTTDLLAIAIVAIGVLTISGRLLDWWSTDASEVLSPTQSASDVAGTQLHWGSGDSAVNLVAGDFPVELERRVVRGSVDDVEAQLVKRCQNILESESFSRLPKRDGLQRTEQRLLAQLDGRKPLTHRDGLWSIYDTDHSGSYLPATMLIGVRETDTADAETSQALGCWAVAIPHGTNHWTTFVFTPTNGQASSSAVSLPEDAEPVLSLRTPAGDELSVFRSREGASVTPDLWRRTIEESLTRAGWQTVRPWQQSEAAWSLRVEGELPGKRYRAAAIELSLRQTDDRRLSCIVNVIRKQ